jgi:glycine dehydrogenase subunit 1
MRVSQIFSMKFIPNSGARDAMLGDMGFTRESLFSDVPATLRKKLFLPPPLSEIEVENIIEALLQKNRKVRSFLGAGCFPHHIPSVIPHLLSRSEFYTSYTPYQAEISQGMLQALFEYQSLMAELVGLPIVNASMYDWGSAISEAALTCHRIRNKSEFLIADTISPHRRAVMETYVAGRMQIKTVSHLKNGQVDVEDLRKKISDKTCGFYIENPSFYGFFEEKCEEISRLLKERGVLFVVGVDPISLGIAKPPGEYGADIVVGDAQSLGNPPSFGGPMLGIFAMHYDPSTIRKMPGRLIGLTNDSDGTRGFIMTLQTREQHIRREKATSNICSNEALCAVASAMYLSLMGKEGMRELATLCMSNAHYVSSKINELEGFTSPVYDSIHFKEFTVRHKGMENIQKRMLVHGIQGGLLLDGETSLYCVTEKHTKEDIEGLIDVMKMVGG